MERLKELLMETNIREKVSMFGGVVMALATLYVGIAEIWGLPGGEEVLTTAKFIVAAIGTVLGIRTCIKKLETDDTAKGELIELVQKVGDSDAKEDN